MAATWVDLLDPTPEEVRASAPGPLQERAIHRLLAPPEHEDEPRPTLLAHGKYVFGIFLVAVVKHEENEVAYQEIDVVATHDAILTVRKTPRRCAPFEVEEIKPAVRDTDSGGMILYRIVDTIAEKYLDLIDDVDEEIDELEDMIEELSAERTRARISHLRHDLLHIRRTLTPMRDAVRRVVDDVIEVDEGPEVFPHDVELAFNFAYDKFLRATDGLDLARDLLAGVRDYAQAKIANDQNEVMKRLTVVASLLLVPTLIVGIYGQNFRRIPELHWGFGYAWSWGWIIVTTLLQLWYFRRKKWI